MRNIPTDKQVKRANYEHHSNLALLTTAMAMISFAILLLIYRGERNYLMMDFAMGIARVVPVLSWIAAAYLAVKSVRARKKYMAEYIIYMIVMPFGLFFMYNMPVFAINLLNKIGVTYSSRIILMLEIIVAALYFVVSLTWHIILATPRKQRKAKQDK